jgi:hypothetical protein
MNKLIHLNIFILISAVYVPACTQHSTQTFLNPDRLATKYYGADTAWYLDNIPFFECSDSTLEQVYYYRWKLYKSHIRNVGPGQFVVTEFINHVGWDRDPWCTINAASMHHIYEGRWLKDDRFVNGYINYLFQQGGNNRRYSESVADAAWAHFLVHTDTAFLTAQLDSMIAIFNGWYDHFDSSKNLYYIPAMPDATEYTIASIDASGGKDGFEGGDAFRPTINSYMYGNAMAIARIAALKGDQQTSAVFAAKANEIKSLVEQNLWNDSLQHFTDRFKVNNQFVRYWHFIRGRELAGFAPWYFNLPSSTSAFNVAWKHITDTSHLLGQYGLRTNEPSYEYYFKQFVWFENQRGSQWNGPSWPYQTSQALTAMANFLNNYQQDVVSAADYMKILRLYARQHILPSGKINLVENYDPNLGGPIVYYYWSNHYLHSTFNNLIISGLCGIRPSENDTLVINPLIDSSINYFCLSDINYHGRSLTVAYDKDGSRYKSGRGLSVLVNGKKVDLITRDGKSMVVVGNPVKREKAPVPVNLALNISRKDFPVPHATVNAIPDSSLYQAIDGRIWYYPEITNYWTTRGSKDSSDWYSIDFGQPRKVSELRLYFFEDGKEFAVPDGIMIVFQNEYLPSPIMHFKPKFTGNTGNVLKFDTTVASKLKIWFNHKKKHVALTELECY